MDEVKKPDLQDYAPFINMLLSNKLWPNAQGQLEPLSEMSVARIRHIMHCINKDQWRLEYLPLFKEELQRRLDCKQFELYNLKKNIGDIL